MSNQPYLMGMHPEPRIGPARVRSDVDRLPGDGKHIVSCESCGRTVRRKRAAKYCGNLCKSTARHAREAAAEGRKKRRAMRGSAAKNASYLAIARKVAREICAEGGKVDADCVRLTLEARGILLPWGGWAGSIFLGREWIWTGELVTCQHKGSRHRLVKVWRYAAISD